MNETVSVEIMGEQFTIKCPSDQKANLIKAATMVHEAMKKISDQGIAFGVNRIAVMAALNIANDAITGNTDMASKIRTEFDSEMDLDEIQNKIENLSLDVENSLNSGIDLKLQ